MKSLPLALVCLALALSQPAHAQDSPVETPPLGGDPVDAAVPDDPAAQEGDEADESDQFTFWPGISDNNTRTMSSRIVTDGFKIYEFTMRRSRNDDAGVKRTTDQVMETTVRTGMGPKMELSIGFAGFLSEEIDDRTTPKMNNSGHGDLRLGGKIQLMNDEETGVTAALYADVSLPTGSRSVSSRRVDPRVGITFTKPVKYEGIVRTFGSLGVSWISDHYSADGDVDTLSQLDYSLGVGVAGFTAEFYGDASLSRNGGPRNTIRVGGSTIYESNAGNLQSTLYGAWGVSEDANDWEYGIAFSFWRDPHEAIPDVKGAGEPADQ